MPEPTPTAETLGILDELGIELPGSKPRTTGRPVKMVRVDYSRDLTSADMAALALPRGVVQPSLKRIHASHHAVARCMAQGMRLNQIALITGYSYVRVQSLQNDPAFRALIADYEAEARVLNADMHERMKQMGLDALELLHERMQDKPEELSTPLVLDVVKALADRTGHGPNQEVNLRVSSADIIDRPPRESAEEWAARRARELGPKVLLEPPKSGPEAESQETLRSETGVRDLTTIDLAALAPSGGVN